MQSSEVMLKLTDVDVYYGQACALRNMNLEVGAGQIVCLLGANAAGKTTTMKTVLGILKPARGTIEYQGQDITRWSSTQRIKAGIAIVPEGRQLFPIMTVEENLLAGAFTRDDEAAIQEDLEETYKYFPRLRERRKQRAGTLSGGEMQMAATARALMARPKLLCMDEPSMGLAPILVQQNFDIMQELNRRGTTIFLVEQDAHMALSVSDYGYVLQTGEIVMRGAPRELLADEKLAAAYLGSDINES